MTGERAVDALQAPEYPLLPHDKVCYVGQPIAVVVAHVADIVRRYTPETIASLTGYMYLVEATRALQF